MKISAWSELLSLCNCCNKQTPKMATRGHSLLWSLPKGDVHCRNIRVTFCENFSFIGAISLWKAFRGNFSLKKSCSLLVCIIQLIVYDVQFLSRGDRLVLLCRNLHAQNWPMASQSVPNLFQMLTNQLKQCSKLVANVGQSPQAVFQFCCKCWPVSSSSVPILF